MPYLIVFLFFIIMNACFGLEALASETLEYKALIRAVDTIREESGISATAILIVKPDKVLVSETLGRISHESEVTFSAEHFIRIGSISKLFTGLSALALENESEFDLDKPIISYLQKLPLQNPWTDTNKVTTAMLLEHTAGLGDMTGREFSYHEPVSIQEAFLVDPSSRSLRWPPGYHSVYSNSGAGIASIVIEQVSQRPFEAFTKQAVFNPMGLQSATYRLTPEVRQNLITGYNTDGKTPIPYWHTLYRAFGGVNIRVKEMSNVLQILLGKGKLDKKTVFSQETIHRLETPETSLSAKSGLTYGYGLGLYHFNVNGISFIGHGGDADGYLSYLAYSRELQIGYFLLINAFNHKAQNQMRNRIEATLVSGMKAKPQLPYHKLTSSRAEQILGKYQSATSRFSRKENPSLTVISENDLLYTLYKNQKRQLIPVNEFHFRRRGEPVATIALIDKDGKTILQGDIGNFVKPD